MSSLQWETVEELDQKLAYRVKVIRKRRSISQQKLALMSNVAMALSNALNLLVKFLFIRLQKLPWLFILKMILETYLLKFLIAICRRLSMNKNNVIQVFYDGKVVGQLAMRGHSTSFEYDDDWIKTGFPISPFSLPLEKQVFTPTKPYFNGLFGAFADSLPDAWGQLLLNRMLKKYKQNLDSFLSQFYVMGLQLMDSSRKTDPKETRGARAPLVESIRIRRKMATSQLPHTCASQEAPRCRP